MTNHHREILEQILPVLRPYVSKITLFGSMARGDAGVDSDVDLLVTLKPPEERPPLGLRWFDLELELSNRLGRTVEMVNENALSGHLRPYIDPDRVVLYEE